MFKWVVFGMNHETAPLEVRERLALSADEVRRVLQRAEQTPALDSAAVLSTCNRTEMVAIVSSRGGVPQDLLALLSAVRPEVERIPASSWYLHRAEAAVRHLFRVSAGLDSMLVGEPQILGQVKEAYQLYCEMCQPHPVFNKLFHLAFRCGKRVRTETRLGEGAVSVAYAAVELAMKIVGSLAQKTALLIGAGETGELVARHLIDKQIGRLLLCNRTAERAERLAQRLKGQVLPFEALERALEEADVVLCCAESPTRLLTREQLSKVLPRRSSPALFLIDLGVPRNCEPECGRWENVFLYDLDDLKRLAELNLARRREEIPKAETIVEEMIGEFALWHRSLQAEPTIRQLTQRVEAIRAGEVEKHRKRFEGEHWDDLDALTRGIIGKILHSPLEKLKECDGKTSHGMARLEATRELFGLDEPEHPEQDDSARNAQ